MCAKCIVEMHYNSLQERYQHIVDHDSAFSYLQRGVSNLQPSASGDRTYSGSDFSMFLAYAWLHICNKC